MKTTREFQRTDREIINAFMKLVEKKPFEKITVQNIIDEAMVSRSCFYQHFCDKYEIAEKIQDRILEFRRNSLSDITKKKSDNSLNDFSQISLEEYVKYARSLINVHTENVDLIKVFTDEFKREYKAAHGEASELESYFYAGVMYELALFSLEKNDGKSPLPEEVLEAVVKSTYNLLMCNNKDEMKLAIDKYIK